MADDAALFSPTLHGSLPSTVLGQRGFFRRMIAVLLRTGAAWHAAPELPQCHRGSSWLTNRVENTSLVGMELPLNETLTLPGGPTRVQWRRNARARRISLRIDPGEGSVVVTLPPRAGRRAGMSLLMTHADWVSDRIARLPSMIRFADGEAIPIDGKPCRIRHVPQARGGAWLADGE